MASGLDSDSRLTADKCNSNQDCQDHKDDDPNSAVEVSPELKKYTDGGDLGGDAEQVSVDQIPADGKLEGRINEKACMTNKTASNLVLGEGQQRTSHERKERRARRQNVRATEQ